MNRIAETVSLVVVILALAASALAQNPTQEKAPKDELPSEGKITWDIKALEDDAKSWTFLKRTVDKEKKKVSWLLEIKTQDAAKRLQDTVDVGFTKSPIYAARFNDADGVKIFGAALAIEGRCKQGERVHVTLVLPAAETLARTKDIKIAVTAD